MKAALFSGTRDGINDEIIRNILISLPRETYIIHGAANGVDSQVDKIARELGFITIIAMPAWWDKYNKAAGPKRNSEMLNVLLAFKNVGFECQVYAFPKKDSKGTNDLIEQAKAMGFGIKGRIIK